MPKPHGHAGPSQPEVRQLLPSQEPGNQPQKGPGSVLLQDPVVLAKSDCLTFLTVPTRKEIRY
jgi:hypothetical protein